MNAGLYWHGLSIKTWFTATSTRRGACILWWHISCQRLERRHWEVTYSRVVHHRVHTSQKFSRIQEWTCISFHQLGSNMTTIWKSKALKNNTLEFLIITPDWNTCFFLDKHLRCPFSLQDHLVDSLMCEIIRIFELPIPFYAGRACLWQEHYCDGWKGPVLSMRVKNCWTPGEFLDVTWHNYKYRWLEVYAFHSCSISHCTKSSWILIFVI